MKDIAVLHAESQHVWGWPGTANFVLVGAGTGVYIITFLAGIFHQGLSGLASRTWLGLLGPVLAVLGFLALTTEAGHPMRGMHLFRHLRHAWLSRETLFWTVFVFSATLDWFVPSLFLQIVAVLAALALMVSQGFILYQMRAISAWNVPPMPLFFVTSGLMSGSGIAVLAGGLVNPPLPLSITVIAIAATGANLFVWLLYLGSHHNADFSKVTEKLRRPFAALNMVGLGHVVPLVLLFLLMSGKTANAWLSVAETVIGLAMIFGVFLQKKAIVKGISYMKEIRLIP